MIDGGLNSSRDRLCGPMADGQFCCKAYAESGGATDVRRFAPCTDNAMPCDRACRGRSIVAELFGTRSIGGVERILRHAGPIVCVRRDCGFLNHAAIRQLRASANVAATAGARRAIWMAGRREENSAQPRGSDQYSSKCHKTGQGEHALQWDRYASLGGSCCGEVLERQVPRGRSVAASPAAATRSTPAHRRWSRR